MKHARNVSANGRNACFYPIQKNALLALLSQNYILISQNLLEIKKF